MVETGAGTNWLKDKLASDEFGSELTFRDLEIFLLFSRTEHLGDTADALGHSVALIQRAVRSLEQQLGVRLVERQGRRLRLLHAGRVLADQAAIVLRAREHAVHAVKRAAGRTVTRIAVGHNFSLGVDLIPALIADVLAREPDAQVVLQSAPTNDLIANVLSGHLDAAVVSPSPIEPDLEIIPLPSEAPVLIVAANDPLAQRPHVDVADLRERHFVTLLDGSGSRQTTVQMCARAGFTPKVTIETGDMMAIEGMVGAGLVVSIVPARLARHGAGRIVSIPLDAPELVERSISLAYLRKARTRRSITLLREAALAYAANIVARDATN
jgi:DNA-binding transcriptional LysR family regulator